MHVMKTQETICFLAVFGIPMLCWGICEVIEQIQKRRPR